MPVGWPDCGSHGNCSLGMFKSFFRSGSHGLEVVTPGCSISGPGTWPPVIGPGMTLIAGPIGRPGPVLIEGPGMGCSPGLATCPGICTGGVIEGAAWPTPGQPIDCTPSPAPGVAPLPDGGIGQPVA